MQFPAARSIQQQPVSSTCLAVLARTVVCVLLLQAEGLVHVSNISSARLSSAKDAVERGQDVWVKVVSVRWVACGVWIRYAAWGFKGRVLPGLSILPEELLVAASRQQLHPVLRTPAEHRHQLHRR
jgi:hypothetical protein